MEVRATRVITEIVITMSIKEVDALIYELLDISHEGGHPVLEALGSAVRAEWSQSQGVSNSTPAHTSV